MNENASFIQTLKSNSHNSSEIVYEKLQRQIMLKISCRFKKPLKRIERNNLYDMIAHYDREQINIVMYTISS